jgi:hypothetical protein
LLTWFKGSPDTGDPTCVCSFCTQRIAEGELPLRIFRHTSDGRGEELRLHVSCAQQVIVELGPKQHADQPAFAEGQKAFENNVRRGANPYKTGTDRTAWWTGWDDGWDKARG